MGPKSLTDWFTFKSEMTNYKLRYVESTLCLPQPSTKFHVWRGMRTHLELYLSIYLLFIYLTKLNKVILTHSYFGLLLVNNWRWKLAYMRNISRPLQIAKLCNLWKKHKKQLEVNSIAGEHSHNRLMYDNTLTKSQLLFIY
jgi:hypothetical protein